GLSISDATPCSGTGVVGATVDPANVYLAVRFRDEPASAWADLGNGLAGASGIPAFAGTGTLVGGSNVSLDVTLGAPNAPIYYVLGTSTNSFAFDGGILVPTFDVIVSGLTTDGAGASSLSGTWPAGIPGGFTLYAQALIVDAVAIHGLAFTNAIVGTTPY